MSVGGATPGTAAVLDTAAYPGTADNTFDPASTVAGSQPYWAGWWTLTPVVDGFLTLDTGDTAGTGLNDTILKVFEQLPGDPPPGSVLLYFDDDSGLGRTSRLTARPVSAGVTYYIQVGSFDSDGDGITTYHLAASLADAPLLPNPRFFTIPGGTLTDPGLVMGPTVVGAPVMPALSVSRPAEGLPDATFIFDGAAYFDAFGGSGGFIIFDATLSYLADGTCDETSPEVGLNIFTVDHGLPFTWEEDWGTLEVGANDAVDDYGREVPRGQWSLLVERKTYIIQLTTPPGNDVRFILRVSDFGAHTGNLTIPDQAWNVTRNPWPSDTAGDPIAYPTETIPWVRDVPDGTPAAREDGMRSWQQMAAFDGTHDILQAPGKSSPATDGSAIECSWQHARLGQSPGQWWSSDLTFHPPDDSPVCAPLDDNESGAAIFNGRVGYHYESGHAFGGTDSIEWHVYDAAYRLHINDLLRYFTATAGLNPFDLPPPVGFTPDDNPLLSDPTVDYPELLGVDIAMDQLDEGLVGGQTTRMYVGAVDYANADGSSDPWGPAEDAASATEDWRGTIGGPEEYHGGHATDFTGSTWQAVPDSMWATALADEAAHDPGFGTPVYHGALSVVALFDAQREGTVPSPSPTGVLGETLTDESTFQFPVLRFRLRPSTGYYYANAALVPVVEVEGLQPVRLQPRDDDAGIYSTPRMWPPAKSGARLYGSPP